MIRRPRRGEYKFSISSHFNVCPNRAKGGGSLSQKTGSSSPLQTTPSYVDASFETSGMGGGCCEAVPHVPPLLRECLKQEDTPDTELGKQPYLRISGEFSRFSLSRRHSPGM